MEVYSTSLPSLDRAKTEPPRYNHFAHLSYDEELSFYKLRELGADGDAEDSLDGTTEDILVYESGHGLDVSNLLRESLGLFYCYLASSLINQD
jgi:hypothetical protein